MSTTYGSQARLHGQKRPEGIIAHLDPWLLAAVGALLGIGLVMVASSSLSISERLSGDPWSTFRRQAAYAVLACVLGGLTLRVPLRAWREASPALLLLGMVLLGLVLLPGIGREVNGSMRWLRIGPVGIQPSELIKLFVVLYVAGYLVRHNAEVRTSLTGFVKPIAVLSLLAVLLLLEPDYGATAVIFTTALGMLFLGGVPLITFAAWALVIVALMGAVVVSAPYRVERLMSFTDPWADPFGAGFQLTQALIAIGRGEWLGVGLGSSVQKLHYLPEAHTDFLFAVLAEELGFLGVVMVIGLFVLVTYRAMVIGRGAQARGRPYEAFVAYGVGLLIALQAFVNIGVNLGILPTKGLTLPLMSYGGSSLVVSTIAVAIVLRVGAEARGFR